MTQSLAVAVLVGSLRKASYTRAVAQALAGMAPAGMHMDIVGIADLPFYDQDREADPPAAWTGFRRAIGAADAVLFATPEYNRSIPAVLKNAVDVGSRPYGHSVWAGKPAAVISTSPGALGGFGANHHLRQCLVALDMPTLQAPEMYLGHADRLVDASGRIEDASGRQLVQGFLQAFDAWVRRVGTPDAAPA